MGQLERCCLKANGAWRVRQHEAKVDVNDMTFTVDEHVAIVAILQLQDI